MPKWVQLILSAIVAGFATGITSFLAVTQNAEQPLRNLSDISEITWAIIGAGALLMFFQNIQTFLKRPPEDGKILKPSDE